jgi:Ni/Co efflux regulator RcnB
MILGAVAAMLLTTLTTAANTDQIDYNKYELDAPVHDMMWCGENNDVILVLT